MSAHTPAPWKHRFEKVRYVIYVDGEIGEKALATTGGAYPDSDANARLIAAAPELLEALQDILRFHEGKGEYNFLGLTSNERFNASNDAWNGILVGMKAAIAKATQP